MTAVEYLIHTMPPYTPTAPMGTDGDDVVDICLKRSFCTQYENSCMKSIFSFARNCIIIL